MTKKEQPYDSLFSSLPTREEHAKWPDGTWRKETLTALQTTEEAEAYIPGVERYYNEAMMLLTHHNISFNNGPQRRPPSLIFAETVALNELVKNAMKDSKAPHNDSRSYAHFQPHEYAIYLSIDEWRELLQDEHNRNEAIEIFVEELVHAYTTHLNDSPRTIRVGFSRYPKGPKQPLPTGVYHWNAGHAEKPTNSQASMIQESLQENPRDITLTENITRLAVALCVPSNKDILVFYREQQHGEILPLLMVDKQTIRQVFGSKDIVERLIAVMASGKRENIQEQIVKRLIEHARDPMRKIQIYSAFTALGEVDGRVIDISSSEVRRRR